MKRLAVLFLFATVAHAQTVTVTMSDDKDGGGNRIGTLIELDFASSTSPMEMVTFFPRR